MSLKINIPNEYSKLKTVIVGDFNNTPFPKTINNMDLTFRAFYNDNIMSLLRETVKCKTNITLNDVKYLEEDIQGERNEDLDNLAKVLVDFGAIVYRPNGFTETKEINSPNWTNTSYPAGNVRDNILIVDKYVVETSPHLRGRIFENEQLYDILYDYFELDKEMKWFKLPQSSLKEGAVDQSYFDKSFVPKHKLECVFDAAQCMLFDEGLIVNVANKNHELGYDALRRMLPEKIKMYKVSWTDNHIDTVFCTVAKNTILVNPKYTDKIKDTLPKFMKNYKKIIMEDVERYDNKRDGNIYLASEGILINCLCVDNYTVVISDKAVKTIKKLERLGIEVIPVRFRHSRLYSGGIHCSTLPLDRYKIV